MYVSPVAYPNVEVKVVDDLQRTVALSRPAERIVSLAPHLTELVHSSGAGSRLAGVSRHCDYPPPVSSLPKVSDYMSINYELLTTLHPDLILVWSAGLKDLTLRKLTSLYHNVYVSDPEDFDDIAENLLEIAVLSGNPAPGQRTAARFLEGVNRLAALYANAQPKKTLYLVWHTPPMTVGEKHWISRAISLCNATNVFANTLTDIVRINRESLQLMPIDVVVHSLRDYPTRPETLLATLGLPAALPVSYVEDDLLQRPSLRIIQGAIQLCQAIHGKHPGK